MEVLTFPYTADFNKVSPVHLDDLEEDLTRQVLVDRIESELRSAKARYSNGKNLEEVLLPSGLLHSVASDILAAARDEPCGIRGCVLNIDFSAESQGAGAEKRVGKVVCDPYSVTTFELSLTLRSQTSWTFKLPRFFRNLTNRTTLVISSNYSIAKKQLYSCF